MSHVSGAGCFAANLEQGDPRHLSKHSQTSIVIEETDLVGEHANKLAAGNYIPSAT
jgi:hypothetical protein